MKTLSAQLSVHTGHSLVLECELTMERDCVTADGAVEGYNPPKFTDPGEHMRWAELSSVTLSLASLNQNLQSHAGCATRVFYYSHVTQHTHGVLRKSRCLWYVQSLNLHILTQPSVLLSNQISISQLGIQSD